MSNTGYVIELTRWGITKGLPSKPYTDVDFQKANNNVIGFNNALQYAYDNGYTNVLLPRGEYAICFPHSILMRDYITFDLNKSTIKVIYDSDRKSPLDTRTTTDYYKFVGMSFRFSGTKHSTLTNGVIQGDKWDRSFTNPNEKYVEGSYGVHFEKGAHFCNVNHCDISGYMGDNITISSTGGDPVYWIGDNQKTRTLGKLDYTTGEPVISTTDLTTVFIDLPSTNNSFVMTGAGYTRRTALTTNYFDVFYYRADGTFMGVLKERKIYTRIFFPVGATKMKIRFYNETDVAKHLWNVIQWGSVPHHNIIEYNDLHDGHRGGVTFGGSYNILRHNVLRHNGKTSDDFMDGRLNNEFAVTTRYHLNQEDSYGDNLVVEKNLIIGGFHGLLIGCYSMHIRDNHLYHCGGTAINLYTIQTAVIEGNYIYNCGNAIGLMGSNVKAFVSVRGNYIFKGSTSISNDTYRMEIYDNTFDSTGVTLSPNDTKVFRNNKLINSSLNASSVKDCYFESTTSTDFTFSLDIMEGCTIKNMSISFNRKSTTVGDVITLKDCDVTNSTLKVSWFGTPTTDIKTLEVHDSRLTDTKLMLIAINGKGRTIVKVKNCLVKITSIITFIESDTNNYYPNNLIEIRDSKFIITRNISQFFTSTKNLLSMTAKILNCEFVNPANTVLDVKLYANPSHLEKLEMAGNTTDGIRLFATDESAIVRYNTERETLSGQAPIDGRYKAGQIAPNVNPAAGGYVGWVCITEGYANNTAWRANTAYVTGTRVNTGGNVYECIIPGTSGTTAPTHTVGTAKDGDVTWKYLGRKASFKEYGLISQ